MKNTFLLTLTIALVSCGSDGDSASNRYTAAFTDSAVSSFVQSSGVAKTEKPLQEQAIEIVMPSAYAASGNISCILNESVSFDIDLVSPFTDVDVSTTCSSSIIIDIRRALLASMENKRIIRVDSSGNRGSHIEIIQLNPTINFWNQYRNVLTNTPDNEATLGVDESSECKDMWTISSTGTVSIAYDSVNSTGTEGQCTYNEDGANEAERIQNYTKQLPFKFENGRFVLDGTGTGNFNSPGDTVYFCIDDNSDNACD